MATRIDTAYWLEQPQWLFVMGSLIAAVVALVAEGPGQYVGFALLVCCVVVISAWSLTGKPTLSWTVAIVTIALLTLGWTVEQPEPALFQSILITAAVGWRIDRLSHSLALLLLLASVPLLGSLGVNHSHWAWWNWSVGTLFTWSLGRVIRLLEQTLNELTIARTNLIDSATKNAAKEERLRISRDVHDLVGHSLTAMLLNIRAARQALGTVDSEAHQALSDAEYIGTTGMAEIRAAMVDLRSNAASEPDDHEALSSLPDGESVLRLLKQQDHIAVSTSGELYALNGPLAIVIYRVLQECITNISRYAATSSATIRVEVKPDEVLLDSQNVIAAAHRAPDNRSMEYKPDSTLGLISMRERVASLGGCFSAGAEGESWKVYCRLPRHG